MAVLFDSFSYRIKKVEGGIYYDRWHSNEYPELTLPEHLYYLNRIINCLLTHDKIFIRVDSLEEFMDVMGFDAFKLLYDREEIAVLDNWWFPTFMQGKDNMLFMNMCKSNYDGEIIKRIFNRYGTQESLFIKQVLENMYSLQQSHEYDYWNDIAENKMIEDFSYNSRIRALLDIKSENVYDISEKDTMSAVRLCLFERSLVWASNLQTDELILEEEAKHYLIYKNDQNLEESLNDRMNKYLYARNIPNLSLLYYNKIIDIKKIIEVRDSVFGGFYRDWLQSNNYDPNELERVLLGNNATPQVEKWLRWGFVSLVGLCFSPVVGLGISLLDEKIPSFNQKVPDIFFDQVLSKNFNTRTYKKALIGL